MLGVFGILLRCTRGLHERSASKVRKVDGEFVSACQYCRTPMRRRGKRDWIVDRGAR